MPGPVRELAAVSAVVLAGGGSRRFGSDKLAVDIDGAPLLHRAIRAVAPVSDEVLVVGAPAGLPVEPPKLMDIPVRVILDAEPGQGPLAALAHAAGVARHDRIVVIGGDMPELREAALRRLLEWPAGQDGACLVADGWDQPLPLGLDRRLARSRAAALVADGQRSMRALLATLDLERVAETEWRALDPDGRTLRDIDRPEDLS